MDEILEQLGTEDRARLEKGLRNPDLYSAQSIKASLGYIGVPVRIPDIYSWRKARGIKKSSC